MDAEPAESTDELAELAELGFSGRVDSFSDAVLSPTAGGPEYRPVVVRITEVTVWDGSLPDSAHGDVYLTLPGARPASAYTDAIPAGTPIAAYANSLTSPASGPAHFSVKSGVPAGEDLYTVVHPDGLGIQIERDGGTYLVLPMDGAVARGKTVQALAPGETLPAR
ncbi:MAG: hypothetical protein Q4F65_13635 [Propionibacteriaceae bacterium]|nr:hypothetical protein [Propionibacteriaceae bacterium]